MSKRQQLPNVRIGTIEGIPVAWGSTNATVNNRTYNIRLAMNAARRAFGKIDPGDKFLTIAYPALDAVLVIRDRM
ncbi:MAG: hypothetical protein AMS18_00180 [Gemmatimonas sp. SG8_17]|nr:MAG: hypothetical protein AMS18_00180 [Gemmatimonas sp. SG8_17]